GPRRSTHDTPPDDRLEVRQHMTRLNRRRRLAAVAVLALAAVTASACSSSSGDSDDGGGGAYLVWDPYPQFADDSDWVALLKKCGTSAGVTVERTGYDTTDLTNKA